MPVVVDGQICYRMSEACALLGVSRSTLIRWLKQGAITGSECRDRRGWRLFTQAQLEAVREKTHAVSATVLTPQPGRRAKQRVPRPFA